MPFSLFGYSPVWLISIAIQLYFGLHAVRTGRFGWLFIILFFPFLGCLIYFIAEYYPEIKGSRSARRLTDSVVTSVANTLDPGKRVRELEARLKLTPSFANRQALADAYLDLGRLDEALKLYEENSLGIHGEDPGTLRGLALTWYKRGEVAKALGFVVRYRAKKETSLSGEMDFLYAELLEKSGDREGALAQYRALARQNADEAARFHAGLLFRSLGREDEAVKEFEEIVANAEVMGAHHRKVNKAWIEQAKRELKKQG